MCLVVFRLQYPFLAAVGEQAFRHGARPLRVQARDIDLSTACIVGGIRARIYRVKTLAGLRGVFGFRDRLQRKICEMLF